MLPSIALTALSHVLNGESWACRRLQPYAGKSVHLSIFPLMDVTILIQSDGKIAASYTANTDVDTTLNVAPALLPRLITHDESAFHEIHITGDRLLANELLLIARNLHWDVEYDLNSIFGDIIAHRIVQTGKNLIQWQTHSLFNVSRAMTEYLSEEKPVLSNRASIDHFTAKVNLLNEQVTDLEKRISHLRDSLAYKTTNGLTLPTGNKKTS